MKGLIRMLFLALIIAGFVSCSSINKELIRSVKNVAVISIVFDKKVDVSGVSSGAGLVGLVSSLAQNNKFKLDTEVNQFKDQLFKNYSSYFPFKLMSESVVLNQKEYQQVFKSTQSRRGELVAPVKYAVLDLSKSEDYKLSLQAAPNAEGVMLVRVHFALQKTGLEMMGVGAANVYAYASIIVFNKSGKDILVINQWASSDGTLTYALDGVFNGDEVIPLAKQASKNVMAGIKQWLEKNPL